MKAKRIGHILIGLLVGMFALDLIFEMLNASCSIVNMWNEDKLKDHGVTEVYSNGVVVWKDGKITDGVARAFLAAKREYELINSDAR